MVRESFVALLAGVALSSGCAKAPDDSAKPAEPTEPVATEAKRARTPTVFDDQLKSLEKAKAVQATLDKSAADTEKAIKESGG